MNYLSVCSGIEAATCAWHSLGWQAVAFSEIEKFPSAVLSAHYPSVPNWGDMTAFQEWPDAAINVLVGGTPCQSFSVAGLRRGMADPRGNLALTYLAIADRYRPRWLVWENVPGVLSSDDGRAFGALLGGMEKLGYGWAYRTLDAQYFNLAQRRKRVFIVASLGGWAAAASVLFEPESLQGHPAPRRETGKRTAPTLSARTKGGGGLGTDTELDGGLIASSDDDWPAEIAPTLNAHFGDKQGLEDQHALNGAGLFVPCIGFNGRQDPVSGDVSGALDADPQTQCVAFSCKDYGADAGDKSPTLRAMNHNGSHANASGQIAVAYAIQERAIAENPDTGPDGAGFRDDDCAYTLEARQTPQAVAFDMRGREGGAMPEGPHETANIRAASGGSSRSYVAQPHAVRRLTPTECERLQGFPDGYTAINYRGKQAPDGPRQTALGNSMAVPVMAWIGRRLDTVDSAMEVAA